MTEEYPRINAEDQQGRPDSVLEFYKNMIRFRQTGPHRNCLIYGKIEPVQSSENVIAYKRYTEDEEIICLFNLGGMPAEEILPYEDGILIWKSSGSVQIDQTHLTLQPYQAVMIKK